MRSRCLQEIRTGVRPVVTGASRIEVERLYEMKRSDERQLRTRLLGFADLLYYALMLLALIIGLYGLFSLLWLSGNALERSAVLIFLP